MIKDPITSRKLIGGRPYNSCFLYFLLDKIGGRAILLLMDTRCTTKMISKHMFDRLLEPIRSREYYEDAHGTLGDGSILQIYGALLVTS